MKGRNARPWILFASLAVLVGGALTWNLVSIERAKLEGHLGVRFNASRKQQMFLARRAHVDGNEIIIDDNEETRRDWLDPFGNADDKIALLHLSESSYALVSRGPDGVFNSGGDQTLYKPGDRQEGDIILYLDNVDGRITVRDPYDGYKWL